MSDRIACIGIGLFVAFFLICIAGWGMEAKRRSIAEDCARVGTFFSDGVAYDCKPRAGSN